MGVGGGGAAGIGEEREADVLALVEVGQDGIGKGCRRRAGGEARRRDAVVGDEVVRQLERVRERTVAVGCRVGVAGQAPGLARIVVDDNMHRFTILPSCAGQHHR